MILKYLRHIKLVYIIVVAVAVVVIIIGVVWGLAHKKPAVSVSPRPTGQLLASFSVGGNGEARVSSIMVDENSWGTIVASSTLNGKPITFTINTNSETVVRRGTETSDVKSLIKGDVLTVSGTLQDFGEKITLLAKDIRTLSNFQQTGTTGPRTPPTRATTTPKVVAPVKK